MICLSNSHGASETCSDCWANLWQATLCKKASEPVLDSFSTDKYLLRELQSRLLAFKPRIFKYDFIYI